MQELAVPLDDNMLTVTRHGNRLIVLVKELGIELDMTWYSRGYMNYKVCVPSLYCLNAVGHLGNCDGIANDPLNPHQRKYETPLTDYSACCYL